jgi:alpha-ribazole phosphatase
VSRLVLVRHAEPEERARGLCYGTLDVGLSDKGGANAARLAETLAALECDAVYASPRRRTRETAVPLAAARGLEMIVDDDLRELDFGAFEGRRYEEIEQTHPDIYRRWMEAPTTVRFPEGESFGDLRVRALGALGRIRSSQSCAVVVTHGGVIRAGLAAWLGMPDAAIFRLAQSYCGVTVVDWHDEFPVVRLMNGGASVASHS